jgi:hypothetical protein
VSVVRLIVGTRSSDPPASGKIIKEMPDSLASGTPYIYVEGLHASIVGELIVL